MNPYRDYVDEFVRVFKRGADLPLGGIDPLEEKTVAAAEAPLALIFSPHPDDECIIGGWALRLMRESGYRVINIAVTLGSNQERREGRWRELSNACRWIGFGLEAAVPGGLERINPETRSSDPGHWQAAVEAVAGVIKRHQPKVMFFPHEQDWNSTHVGTHFLVMDALKRLPSDFSTYLVETEFWGQMDAPNVMVELGKEEVADLLAALSFHVGEVKRNPYHLRLPGWLQDNVRRGAELVGGQGGAAPSHLFATLYRLGRFREGRVHEVLTEGQDVPARVAADRILPSADRAQD